MPYVRRGRGMGQSTVNPNTSSGNLLALSKVAWDQCPWWDVVCALQTLTTGTSDYQNQLNPLPTPPANLVAAPGAPQTQQQMTQPAAWTPQDSAATMQQQTDQNMLNWFNSLPDYTGGTGPGSTPCDWTQASWLSPLTWCGTNWLIAGGALIAALSAFSLLGLKAYGGAR